MDKFSELKAAAMAATPGRIGDRIYGSGSIKYECTGYDGSLVLRTDHKDMEYGFVGDNADSDELFFRLCVPDVVLELLADNEHLARELVARNGDNEWLRKRAAELEAKLSRMPRACDGKEQDAFIKFALNNKFSTECHPMHFLFLDKQTSAARRAWGAAIAYCSDTVEGDE